MGLANKIENTEKRRQVRHKCEAIIEWSYFNKEISICGELAHEPKYIPFLPGIGVRALSVYPKFLPSVQKIISNLKISDADIYADQLLAENSLKGIGEVL